jgi:hypothetical protein
VSWNGFLTNTRIGNVVHLLASLSQTSPLYGSIPAESFFAIDDRTTRMVRRSDYLCNGTSDSLRRPRLSRSGLRAKWLIAWYTTPCV